MTKDGLYAMLRDKYKVGDQFIAAYLTKFFGVADLDMEGFRQKTAANPNLQPWLDYALSTNQRGRDFASILRPLFPHNARRYLDVGSAYGGFLIGFMEQGLEVTGIEYEEKLVQISHANLRDFGLQDVSRRGDVLDKDLLAQLGKFDIITCIDVIEHVTDVPGALRNMVDMLNPGGILVLQMPNKDSISNIISDPHFGIFGITLLGHDQARAFYFHHFPTSNFYDVGEYLEQRGYLGLLTSLGCQATAQPPMVPTRLMDKARLTPRFLARLGRFLFDRQTPLPLGLRLKTALLALRNLAGFWLQLPLAKFLPGLRAALKVKYADDAWLIVGRKASPDRLS